MTLQELWSMSMHEHLVPHRVEKDGEIISEIFDAYLPARQWAIAHGLAHEEGRWLVRHPGIEIVAVIPGREGLEDLLV